MHLNRTETKLGPNYCSCWFPYLTIRRNQIPQLHFVPIVVVVVEIKKKIHATAVNNSRVFVLFFEWCVLT